MIHLAKNYGQQKHADVNRNFEGSPKNVNHTSYIDLQKLE